MRDKLIVMTIAMTLTGCAAPQVVQPVVADGEASATVLVYREPSFNSGLVALHFGADGQVYLALRNGQYGQVQVTAGARRLSVGGTGTQNFYLDADLATDSMTCIRAFPDPANIAKVAVPLLMNLTNAFKMEVVECPDEESLADFERVSADWRGLQGNQLYSIVPEIRPFRPSRNHSMACSRLEVHSSFASFGTG